MDKYKKLLIALTSVMANMFELMQSLGKPKKPKEAIKEDRDKES